MARSSAPKTFIEFFAGIGLIHYALEPLGWELVLANDIDEVKAQTYRANFPGAPLHVGDVHELNVSGLPRLGLATASFPCIDVSQAGRRIGIDGTHSRAVWGFLDRVTELDGMGNRPDHILIENVPGLLWLHEGKSIDALLRRLADMGYGFDVVQVDARSFLPQSRNRLFVIASHLEIPHPEPQTDPFAATIRRYRVKHVYERDPKLPWRFYDFPEPPRRTIPLEQLIEQLEPEDERWWAQARLDYFWSHLERDHGIQMRLLVETKATTHLTAVRRGRRRGLREQIFNVRWEGVASCVRTPKGGSSTQFVVEVDDGTVRVRRILGIEAARLQGVGVPGERTFEIPPSEHEALYAFGDAVCVPVVRWVMRYSIETAYADKIGPPAHQTTLALV